MSAVMVQHILTHALGSLPFNMARCLMGPDQVGMALT